LIITIQTTIRFCVPEGIRMNPFTSSRLSFSILFTLGPALAQTAFAQTTTPITLVNMSGPFDYSAVVRPASLNGTGTVSPFGSAGVSFSGSQNLGTAMIQGTFTFSFNRLDSFNVTGTPQFVSKMATIILPGAISGGTGTYSGATGSVTYNFNYTATSSSVGTFTFSGAGNITVGQTTTPITLTGFNGPASVAYTAGGQLPISPPGSVSPFGTATVNFGGIGNQPGNSAPIPSALTFTFNANDSFTASFSFVYNFASDTVNLPCTIVGGTGAFVGATGTLNAVFTASPNGSTFTLTGLGSITQPTAGNSKSAPAITSITTANGGATIAQNTFIVIKGTNLVPANTAANGVIWSSAASFLAGLMPTQLGGISVTVNNKPAFVYFYCSAATDTACSQDQLNILTPLDSTIGPVPVVVSNAGTNGAGGAAAIPSFTANMQAIAPAFLLFDIVGHIAATHANYSLLAPPSLYAGAVPAKPGETILLYAVGFGLTATALVNGSAIQSGSLPALPVCEVGGAPAALAFAGLSGTPGLYQLNLTIPLTAANGDNTVTCSYTGFATPAGNLITVQN
jgi:uncharacterized protein (TIGR03437 family)